MKKQLLAFVLLICCTLGASAQLTAQLPGSNFDLSPYNIAVVLRPEWHMGPDADSRCFSLSYGTMFEARFTRHSSVELGVFFRNYTFKSQELIGNRFKEYNNRRGYISIPLSYRYTNRILDISAGVSYDIRVSEVRGNPWAEKEAYADRFGLLLRVSKPIVFSPHFTLEPSVQWNPYFESGSLNSSWLGVSVSLKYHLFR